MPVSTCDRSNLGTMSGTPQPPFVVFSDDLDFVDSLHELSTHMEGVDVQDLKPVVFDSTGLCIELVAVGVRRDRWGVHVGSVSVRVTEERNPEKLRAMLLARLEDEPLSQVRAGLPLPELVAAVRAARSHP